MTVVGILKALLVLAAIVYAALLAFMYFYQRSLQYHPDRVPLDPAAAGVMNVQRVSLRTSDGETITAWFKPPPSGQPTIIYFHGNGGSIASRPNKIGTYAASRFGVLAVSYRGYGDSSGTPSEAGLMNDARAAYGLLEANGAAQRGVFLIGESLGSGVAIQLAAEKKVVGLALEAPYFSAADVGSNAYPFLPVRLLMKDQFRSSEFITRVNAPLLIQHGTDDALIPFEQGQKLFALANEPKQFIALKGGTHDIIADETTWARELAFFERQAGALKLQ